LLVQVVDFSDGGYRQQMEVTAETLKELNAGDIPQIIVYNKADKCDMADLPRVKGNQIYMIAKDGVGLEELVKLIQSKVYANQVECDFLIPYEKGAVASYLMQNGSVVASEYREDGIWLRVNCYSQDADKYAIFRLK
jgi:GTP-binding protein HflX